MPIFLKNDREIEQMRAAGQLVAETFERLTGLVVPGVTTAELDRKAEEYIRSQGGRPMYKGYRPPGHTPFPATICVAVNNQIVHGIPSEQQVLQDGDIIGIDIGAVYNGWVGDACRTYPVGNINALSRRLMDVTRRCLDLGIEQARPGKHLGDIGAVIQTHAERAGFSVVRELYGHGIGKALWEEPNVRHWATKGTGVRIQAGMVFTIEPMINAGSPQIRIERDGWTISTADGSRSAQYEDTLAIREDGPDLLTRL